MIGIIEIPGNEFVPLDWMYRYDRRAAFGEKYFVTVVILGNGYRTAMPRTAFQAFVTVVAALFQELGIGLPGHVLHFERL